MDPGLGFVMSLKATWSVLYCPVPECVLETPFKDANVLLAHLQAQHQVTICNSSEVIPFLDRYLQAKTVSEGDSFGHQDAADDQLRQRLHIEYLRTLLDAQQMERNTVQRKQRVCILCSEVSADYRDLFEHMYQMHHYNIGLLENLIDVEPFINELEDSLKLKKTCLYCKEVFKNGSCLRKHLKAKKHCKIDPKDNRWDRYYMINYINLMKRLSYEPPSAANQPSAVEEESDGWSDLADSMDEITQCLFCSETQPDPDSTFAHMRSAHGFDFHALQRKHALDFYSSIKLINYFRFCQRNGTPHDVEAGSMLPESGLWNRPEYYFPLYEEDPLLTAIEEPE